MVFQILDKKDDLKDVFDLIKESFNINSNCSEELLDNQKVLAMYDKDDLVGTLIISILNDPVKCKKGFYLDYVSIKESYRNKGLGKVLMNKVINIAESEKIDFIKLTSNKEKKIARRMYESIGMKIVDTDLFCYEINGGTHESI